MFRIAVRETFSLTGTMISEKITNRLMNDLIIKEWVQEQGINCQSHRLKMLHLIVKAKLYELVRQKNNEFRINKSTNNTIGELRHQ
jgi:hypothetical protein